RRLDPTIEPIPASLLTSMQCKAPQGQLHKSKLTSSRLGFLLLSAGLPVMPRALTVRHGLQSHPVFSAVGSFGFPLPTPIRLSFGRDQDTFINLHLAWTFAFAFKVVIGADADAVGVAE